MKKLTILLLATVLLCSCKGDDSWYIGTNVAKIVFVNQSNDHYKIYINNEMLKELDGNSKHKERLAGGRIYRLKAEQSSNVARQPIIVEKEMAISSGYTKEFIFP